MKNQREQRAAFLRDSPNDDHRVSVVSFKDQGSFDVVFFVWVPSMTLKGFHGYVPRTELRLVQCSVEGFGSSHAYDRRLRGRADDVDERDRLADSFRAPSLGFDAWGQSRIPPSP